MSYDYYGYFSVRTIAGRLADFTQDPVVNAVNGRTSAAVNGVTCAKITAKTGEYRVSLLNYADKIDLLVDIVPHNDDQANFADVVILNPIVDKHIDDVLVDTATTIPAQLDTLQGADSDTLETLSDQIDGLPQAGQVSFVSPISQDGDVLTIYPGEDYYYADERILQWSSSDWIDLSGVGTEVKFFSTQMDDIVMTKVDAGEITQKVRMDLPKVQTAKLTAMDNFAYIGVKTAGSHNFSLVQKVEIQLGTTRTTL